MTNHVVGVDIQNRRRWPLSETHDVLIISSVVVGAEGGAWSSIDVDRTRCDPIVNRVVLEHRLHILESSVMSR